MARLDRARLDAACFSCSIELPTRYADLDPQRHVNNSAATVLLQEAGIQFDFTAGVILDLYRFVTASLWVEYADEMFFPEQVTVSTGILEFGRSSFTLGQIARQRGRPTLYAETVMVVADASGPAPMPPDMRARYEPFLL